MAHLRFGGSVFGEESTVPRIAPSIRHIFTTQKLAIAE